MSHAALSWTRSERTLVDAQALAGTGIVYADRQDDQDDDTDGDIEWGSCPTPVGARRMATRPRQSRQRGGRFWPSVSAGHGP